MRLFDLAASIRKENAMPLSTAALDWLATAIGRTQQFELTEMQGSTSASIFLVQPQGAARADRCVLRVLDNHAWLAEEPDVAQHEAAALEQARALGLRAPRLVAYATEEVGFGAPVVLMSFLEGVVELQPADLPSWIDGLAAELAAIHRYEVPDFGWHFVSWASKDALRVPGWTSIPHVWERAIDLAQRPAPYSRSVFIHRDYHPTNVLWRDGVLSGVVDWISACQGPAGVDVAHCRTDLALMYGPQIAEQFLQAYLHHADQFEYQLYWDLEAIFDKCQPAPSYYPPWQHFGLGPIAREVLCGRVDAYLEQIMRRA